MKRLLQRRWFRVLIVVLAVGYILVTIGALFIYEYGQADHEIPSDVIVVLGGGTKPDGSPSASTIRRTQHGAALYHRGLAPYILCTGTYTQRHPKSEAQACAEVAQQEGVPASAILMEERSSTTEENAIEARKVMDAHRLKTALLVSDNYHLLRASMLFERQGVAVALSPAQVTTGPLDWPEAVLDSYREVGALGFYVLRIALGFAPASTQPR